MKQAAAWMLTRVLPVPLWALAMVSLWACVRMVSAASRLAPDLAPGNCWVYVGQEWDRMSREWRAAGMPVGGEPYVTARYSRKEPRNVLHGLVASGFDSESERMSLRSFKPVSPTDAPAWAFWRRVRFEGRVERGD